MTFSIIDLFSHWILQPRTSLEKEIAAVLKGSSGLLERRNKELTESEERALQAVDLQEVRLTTLLFSTDES